MNKYIIVRTYCDREEIADKIINSLLEKKLVAGSQMVEVTSQYWWNNEIRKKREFQLSFRSTYDLFPRVKEEILKLHSYLVPEISCTEIVEGNLEFLDWISNEVTREF